jgi:hypothetical protein
MALAIFIGSLQGIELEISGGFGNSFFDPEKTESLGENERAFEPTPQIFFRTVVSGEIGSTVFYSGGLEWDPVLRSRIFTNIGISFSFFSMEIGPFIGIFNTSAEFFNPGLSAAIGVEFPGILFVNVRASSSINSVRAAGSYSQRSGMLTAGFWVPNIICSFNLETKSFAHQKTSDLFLEDMQNRYFFRADIFAKNNPFSIRLDVGYASLKRTYISQSNDSSDEFKYIFLGMEAAVTINPLIRVFLAGELPLFSWSVLPMKNPDKNKVLFQVQGGIVLSFP